MKTAVSIPDDVFEEAERLAADLETSRSQLYSRALREFVSRHSPSRSQLNSQALREFVARHAPDRLTEAMNRVVDTVGTEVDEFSRRAAHLVLEHVEW
jgi:metal-responsive CopG/Arc/MetJ family transcriptional regulator